jgi:hypothetical protein
MESDKVIQLRQPEKSLEDQADSQTWSFKVGDTWVRASIYRKKNGLWNWSLTLNGTGGDWEKTTARDRLREVTRRLLDRR